MTDVINQTVVSNVVTQTGIGPQGPPGPVGEYVDVKSFGALGDGVADDTDAIQSAATAAVAAGGGILRFPAGTYVTSGRIDIGSNLTLEGDGAILHAVAADATAGATALLLASGTDGTKATLDANIAAKAKTVTLPSGSGASFDAGDIIGFESTDIAYGTTRSRELHGVVDVSGDVVTVDQPIDHAYTTAATAQFWKVDPIRNVAVKGLKFTTSDPLTNTQYAIRFKKCQGCSVDGVTFENLGGGIALDDVLECSISNLNIDQLPNYGNAFGYGILFAGATANCVVTGLRARETRHVISTVGDYRAPNYWGGPRDVSIIGAIGAGGPDTFSIYDTHEQALRFLFADCTAIGSGSGAGFQVRGQQVTLANCKASGAAARGVHGDSGGSRLTIQGGEFFNNGTNGIAAACANTVITGATVRDNTGAGITTAGAGVLIKDCVISGNLYGIQDSGATVSLIAQGNAIPQSTAQAIAFLSFGTTAGSAAAAINNYVPGYAGNNYSVSPNANSIFRGNHPLPNRSVASASMITVASGHEVALVTGTTNITSVTIAPAGSRLTLIFASSLTFTDGSNLVLAGDFATTSNDTISLVSDGTNWIETSRSVN